MSLPTLSLPTVRLLQLEAQGLLDPPETAATPADVLASIRRMAALQIDTIHVVARSPYLVLFSRLGAYDPAWLDRLLADGQVFEYWAHAACFLPAEDFPNFRRFMLDGLRGYVSEEYRANHREALDAVLAQVRAVGPVRSADFESEKRPGGWWNWKFEKEALEYWLSAGEVMVTRRDKFQRVYDLRERVLPGWDDARAPSLEETYRSLALRSVRALGVARPGWVWDYFRLPKRATQLALAGLLEEGALCEVAVEGWEEAGLALAESLPVLERAVAGGLQARYTTLLSPFDPLVWHRDRVRQLFGFEFALECYLPAAKRTYGYFVLPVLHRGALVGRLDAKAYRREGVFAVRAFYLEEGLAPDPEMAAEIGAAIRRCAEWHGTPEVRLEACRPASFAPLLGEALA